MVDDVIAANQAFYNAHEARDIVAMIVAETLNQAKDAAERIVVDYEPLPVVTDGLAARSDGAPSGSDHRLPRRGS